MSLVVAFSCKVAGTLTAKALADLRGLRLAITDRSCTPKMHVFVEVRALFAEATAIFAEVPIGVLQREAESLSGVRWKQEIQRYEAVPGDLDADAQQDKCYDPENTMRG